MAFESRTIDELKSDVQVLKRALAVPNLPDDEANMHTRLVGEMEAEIKFREGLAAIIANPEPTPSRVEPPPSGMSPGVKVLIAAVGCLLVLAVFSKKGLNSGTSLKPLEKTPKDAIQDSVARARVAADLRSANLGKFQQALDDLSRYRADMYAESSTRAIGGAMKLEEIRERVIHHMNDDSLEIGKQAAAARSKLIALQKKSYPQLRSMWGKHIDKAMWSEDIDVIVSGATVTFVGGQFAANSNIADFYGEIKSTLVDLRFKRANFKWIPSAEEYDYYKIESPADGDL